MPEMRTESKAVGPKDYPALKANIEKKLPITNATAMSGAFITVFFEDGTRWFVQQSNRERPGTSGSPAAN